ncbi:hypothetical protein PV10_00252 [Exophiala mesophila]|uniref:tRNA (guanine(9)-N1)-methyltransferase n=1 Tax=Exophiala mesophila TaxID=212818 RepID=A0A0D1Y6L5_EXOME|nr:uncharacterized protein PV10_00252 [Exophiala mesophila]KIV96371.1 hypothetical protein PV10_00252 [Exophiala mesophila]
MDLDERPSKVRKVGTAEGAGTDLEADAPLLTKVIPPSDTQEAAHAPAGPLKSEPSDENDSDARLQTSDSAKTNGASLESTTQTANGEPDKPMSKNQLKKQRKREAWEAGRPARKEKRKQKLLSRKQRRREARDEASHLEQSQGGEDSEVQGDQAQQQRQQQDQISRRAHRRRQHVILPVTIIIDCGFDDLMTEKERISLGSQLTRSYSDNSRAQFQTNLVISSWGGLLKERFDTILAKNYLNWRGVTFDPENFAVAAEKAKETMKGSSGGDLKGIFKSLAAEADEESKQNNGSGESDPPRTDKSDHPSDSAQPDPALAQPTPHEASEPQPISSARQQELQDQGEIVYLTSDSDYTLTTLKPYSTYIVGGLVDKNRHKGICYRTALKHNIKTAKLPIGEYMEMTSRKVLATNHVVEIMVRFLECGDWGESFMQVIPKRKGGKLRSVSEDANVQGVEDGDDNDEQRNGDDGEDDDESVDEEDHAN